tara:strand:- start:62913 stop:64553 length:1641 start_codon:yes stop_codon:yes gene_type:complete
MTDTPNENQQSNPSSQQPPRAPVKNWSPLANAMRHDHSDLVTKRGNPIDPADPGNRATRLVTMVLTLIVVTLVIIWQNVPDEWKEKTLLSQPTPKQVQSPALPADGQFGQVDLMGRVFLRGYDLLQSTQVMDQFAVFEGSLSNEDQVRLIMLAGEFEGDAEALDRINELQSTLVNEEVDRSMDELVKNIELSDEDLEKRAEHDLIFEELKALETIYTDGIDALEDEQRAQLSARYGLIGKVALTHGLDDDDPFREPFINNGMKIGIFGLLILIVGVLAPITGFVLLILGIIGFASGKMRMRAHVPTRGGSVFLETYGVFVFGFLVLTVGTFFINARWPDMGLLLLLLQWSLLLFVFWGLVRGMYPANWRKAIGLHCGEGIFKEIGCGIVGYIASIPVYIVGVLVTVVVLVIQEGLSSGNGGEPVQASNPIFDMIANGDIFLVLLLFTLATIWAPLVEEAIFRGALYRHLRGSLHWVLAAFISAVLFAYMHNYGPLLVAPLIALGFMFAVMREWRGSLIAPITAHFMHNFTLMVFMFTLVQLIKDPL